MRSFRSSLALGCLTATCIGAQIVWAQAPPPPSTPPLQNQGQLQAPSPYPMATAVSVNQADVYAGPNVGYYTTSQLKYGERVIVLGENKKAPGWLEIVPPPRSFSWIDAKFVKTVAGMDKIGIVDAGDPNASAPILPGSAVAGKDPNVEITRVKTGTQLFILDRPSAIAGVTMYPIAPVATEVRFLPADALRGGGGAYAAGNVPYSGTTVPTGWHAPAGPATNPYAFIDLSKQADAALASGNADRARLLYVEALGQTNDPAWRNYLTGRLTQLNSGNQPTPVASAYQPPTPPNGPLTGPATTPAAKQWSPWGVLRTAPFTSREGAPMYTLEDRQTGAPLMYVTTQPGGTLRDYVGQIITVYGTLVSRNDDYIRMQYLMAENIQTAPAGAK